MCAVSTVPEPTWCRVWQCWFGGVLVRRASIGRKPLPTDLGAPRCVMVLAVLGLRGTAVAFYLWFAIRQRSTLSRANAFSFLTPVFGVAIGMGFFDESMGVPELAGIGLVVLAMRQVAKG